MRVLCPAAILCFACLCAGQEETATIRARIDELRRLSSEGTRNEERIKLFLHDEAPEVRIEAAVALLKIRPGAREAMAMLRTELRSEDAAIAERAASALASLGEAGVSALVEEVRDRRGRRAALTGLAQADSVDVAVLRELTGVLVTVLSTSADVRELGTCMALATRAPRIARACAPYALLHLRSGTLAESVLSVLDAAGPSESYIGPLRHFINDDEVEFPSNGLGFAEYELASVLLARIGPAGVQVILDRLSTIQCGRRAVALSLGLERNIDTTFDALLEATRSSEPLLRLRALGPLTAARDPKRMRDVASVLARVMLEDRNGDVRAEAAALLPRVAAELGDLEMEQELRGAAVEHPDERVRVGALNSLWAANRLSVDFLSARLDDPSADVRVVAIMALGSLGPRATTATERILAAIDRGDKATQCLDALALIAPGDERVIKTATGLLESDAAVAACRALAKAGPRARGVEGRLRALLGQSGHSNVRLWMRYALWRIARKASDLKPLIEDLRQSLAGDWDVGGAWDSTIEILNLLGTDAHSLIPVIDGLLDDQGLDPVKRQGLEEAKRALG